MDYEIEKKVVDAFVIKRKRERALFELQRQEKRSRLLLSFEEILDVNHMEGILIPIKSSSDVYDLLVSRGAPKLCYVMSVFEKWDGRVMELEKALQGIVFCGFTFVSCIHGKLAYYEGEADLVRMRRSLLMR